MKKTLRAFLTSDPDHKRRRLLVDVVLWLLKLLRDVEMDEMYRYSDMLENSDSDMQSVSGSEYLAMEERYSSCECALGFLESAIEDLEFVY